MEAHVPVGEAGGAVHERRRAGITARIPRWYVPALHLAVPTVVCLGVMVGALTRIHTLRPLELLTLPITLFFAFGFEWRVHKRVLHRRARGVGLLYERHELVHHVVYTHDDMTMRDQREWWLVLMPAYAVVLVALVNTPLAIALGALFGANTGCLYLVGSMSFFLTYEWLHLAYHFPRESRIGRNPLVARLREHHRRHHDPRLMKRWNFNVTVPVFDVILGTLWSPEREAAAEAVRTARRSRARLRAGLS